MKIFIKTILLSLTAFFVVPATALALTSFTSNNCTTEVGAPTPKDGVTPGCTPSTSGGSDEGGGLPGQPLPSNDTIQIKNTLCQQYKVCPTESRFQSPNSAWTLPQLTALWNVVQRIYKSPTYKALAIGNQTLEITRAACYPFDCDGTWGYYAGQVYPQWGTIPGARLIIITNNIGLAQSQLIMEWLFAHEIGHSASGGLPNGSLAGYLGQNEAYNKVMACGNRISVYGRDSSWNENNSEILAYYMTAGEEALGGYLGPSKNLARDYPCVYNAARQYYFGGVEF